MSKLFLYANGASKTVLAALIATAWLIAAPLMPSPPPVPARTGG